MMKSLVLWQALMKAGAKPCGLGARDTLRLEAGFNLYGSDMDETVSPLEANLAWTIDWKDEQHDFVGRSALLAQKEHVKNKLVGLVMEEKGVLGNHQQVFFENGKEGMITSGSFSPTLGCAIALARVPVDAEGVAQVDRRGQRLSVKIVKPMFVRKGEKVY